MKLLSPTCCGSSSSLPYILTLLRRVTDSRYRGSFPVTAMMNYNELYLQGCLMVKYLLTSFHGQDEEAETIHLPIVFAAVSEALSVWPDLHLRVLH